MAYSLRKSSCTYQHVHHDSHDRSMRSASFFSLPKPTNLLSSSTQVPTSNFPVLSLIITNTPSVSSYKQILLFRFIQLMMYVIHNIDHIISNEGSTLLDLHRRTRCWCFCIHLENCFPLTAEGRNLLATLQV